MSARLIALSVEAHKQAIRSGYATPAEKMEFSSYAMRVLDGVPVFDSNRMRDDQVDDVVAKLARLVGRAPQGSVKDDIRRYMQMYGGQGVRAKDVASDLGVDKKSALTYLRQFADDGKVTIKEEPTRGTPRKRYFWVEKALGSGADDPGQHQQDVVAMDSTARRDSAGSGIIHHGTAVGGCQCRCTRCRAAVVTAFIGEAETAARRSGGNQLAAGAEARRVRREMEYRADGVALAAGLAARNG